MYLYVEDLSGGYIGPFTSEADALAHAEKYYPEHYEHRPRGGGYRCEVVPELPEGTIRLKPAAVDADFWDNKAWIYQ